MNRVYKYKWIYRMLTAILLISTYSAIGQITVTQTNATCEKNDGSATASCANGTPPYTYKWSNGQTGASVNHLAKGTYTVSVEDSKGCKGTKTIFIKNSGGLHVSMAAGGDVPWCHNRPAPVIHLTASVSGGTPPYYWAPSQSITVTGSGTYSIGVMDDNGCFGKATSIFTYISVICAGDPNSMNGPEGYGPERFYSSLSSLAYVVDFENDPNIATAPAQKITITHEFDPHMSIFSLRLGDFGFHNLVFHVPPNSTTYSTRLDVSDSIGVSVDVTAGINVGNHTAFWIFQSIDPATGLPPDDPTKGLLPVNDTVTHNGEGFVSFTIKPKSTTVTGDSLKGSASIVFDNNPSLSTNTWLNIADAVPPVSHVNALLPSYDSTVIFLSFTANDDPGGSGVQSLAVYASKEGQDFIKVGESQPDSLFRFTGEGCSTYQFFSIAKDNTGNAEPIKSNAEATTVILPSPQITQQPMDQTVDEGQDAMLSLIVSSAKLFQWEYSNDGGVTWQTVPDTLPFSGSQSPVLTITSAPSYLNGSQFRCIAGNGSCSTTSQPAVLLIKATLSGQVRYDNSLKSPLSNTQVYLMDLSGQKIDSVYTNNSGSYLFPTVQPGTYIAGFSINKPWGGVNATDALRVLRYFSNTDSLPGRKLLAADVNANHKVNAVDALLLTRRFVGYINSFQSGDWLYETDTIVLGSNSQSKNFYTLCFGDVDASNIPGLKMTPKVSLVTEGSLEVKSGDEISLPLRVRKDIAAGAISLEINYPADLFSVEDISLKSSAFAEGLVYRIENGKVKIGWYDVRGLSIEQGDPLVILKLKATEKPLLGSLDLSIEGTSEVADPQAHVFENLQLSVPRLFSAQSAEIFSLGQNYPNPFLQSTEISYYLPEEGSVFLRLYNSLGELVKILISEKQAAGYHSFEFNGSALSPGVYPLRLEFRGTDHTFSQYKLMTKA